MNNTDWQLSSCGIILAGGRGQRMGGVDKALIKNPRTQNPLIKDAIALLGEKNFVITRQTDQQDLSAYGRVLFDPDPNQGPLSALVHAAKWAQSQNYDSLFVLAVDSPFLPQNWQNELLSIARPHALAQDPDGRLHPSVAYYDLSHFSEALSYYESGGRRLMGWLSAKDFARYTLPEKLRNINNFMDLTRMG